MADTHEIGKKDSKKLDIKTDTLLRETSSHYIRLIGDADRKARIMVVVNSIMLTIAITMVTKSVNLAPFAWVSITIVIVANVISLFFSVISIKPELQSKSGVETEDNMLHYKKSSEYTLMEYSRKMIDTLTDENKKRDAILKELYYYGNLLTLKYKLIKSSYRIFLWGVVLCVISYMVLYFMYRGNLTLTD